MPCLRGVELSLTSGAENEEVPEYPHPESSSVQLRSADDPQIPSPSRSLSSRHSVPEATKVDPKVSVYIPSVPGSTFAIRYKVKNTPPPPCRYIYFKLYMNARYVTAWGIDLTTTTKGRVVKSIWRPSSRHSGQVGLEARNFVFLPGQDKKCIADDGGIIEVKVFRARDRRSLAPKLEEFRFQENYGIASPSIGLVDQPQSAFFYEWALIDAKDTPFATFRFHYRSYESLRQLNLIPSASWTRSPNRQRTTGPLAQTDIFNHGHEEAKSGSHVAFENEKEGTCMRTPPKLLPTSALCYRIPEPSKEHRDGFLDSYLQRPLPELPEELPGKDLGQLERRASAVSTSSHVPSITPSLKQSIERGSFDLGDGAEIGVALCIEVHRNETGRLVHTDAQRAEEVANCSSSDYETSPPSTIGSSSSPKKLSPSSYPAATARDMDIFNRERDYYTMQRATMSTQSLMYPLNEKGLAKTKAVNGMGSPIRSPSPARSAISTLPRRVRSPRLQRMTGRSIFSGFLRRKRGASPSSENSGEHSGDGNTSDTSFFSRRLGSGEKK